MTLNGVDLAVPPEAFSSMPQLRQLELQGNALVTLPPLVTFNLPNLVEVVSLTGQ